MSDKRFRQAGAKGRQVRKGEHGVKVLTWVTGADKKTGEPKTDFNKPRWHPANEHREKYSMGKGYYLKTECGYSSSWKISKRTFYRSDNPIESLPVDAERYLASELVNRCWPGPTF